MRNKPAAVGLIRQPGPNGDGAGMAENVLIKAERTAGRVCRLFAEKSDWQHRCGVIGSSEDGALEGRGHELTEDPAGLHSGRYIRLSVIAPDSALAVVGGYYDCWGRAQDVFDELILAERVSARRLDRLFTDMKDGLEAHIDLDMG